MTHFVSTTQLQRESKKILESNETFQVILNNNEFSGIILPKKSAQYLYDAGVFSEIEEELWELSDKETCDVVEQGRKNIYTDKKETIGFHDFKKKYGI